MLVHICCSVDSAYYIRKLKEHYPKERIVGFFYDPNIHPYSEYYLRMIDAKRSCERLGVEFIEGSYDYEGWLEAVRGFEEEPEKGKRCTICFDDRLEASAKKAVELGMETVTTTLLMSPKKDFSTLEKVSHSLEKRYGVRFIVEDFRKGGGTQAQFALSKEEMNYHQNYCGCLFALTDQRESQGRVASELFSPLGQMILPGSIEERVKLYEKRMQLEEKGIAYRVIRERFLNSRMLRAYVKADGKTVPSFFFPGAKLARKKEKARVDFVHGGITYLNRENIKIIDIHFFNRVAGSHYENVSELIQGPPEYAELLRIKAIFAPDPAGYAPLIVLNGVEYERFEIFLDTVFYEDTREFLVTLS